MIDDSPETGAGEMETPIEFTYLDATTMKVVARDDDFEEVYTVTLDAAGSGRKGGERGRIGSLDYFLRCGGLCPIVRDRGPDGNLLRFPPPGRFHLERR